MTKAILSIVIVIGIVVAVVLFKNKPAIAPENGSATKSPVFCTQDAKQCPDGSYVSRQGPKCEFAPCPTIIPSTSKSTSPTKAPTEIPNPDLFNKRTHPIIFSDQGINTNNLTIRVGDEVQFINNSSTMRWPASGPHPTHTICPGFDSLRGLKTGESYSYTFLEAKTCPWHDHLKPSLNGQIVISP